MKLNLAGVNKMGGTGIQYSTVDNDICNMNSPVS